MRPWEQCSENNLLCQNLCLTEHIVPSESMSYYTFCHVTAWIPIGLNRIFPSPIYTQYPIITKWKDVFRHFSKCIHTPESIILHVRFTFGIDYSCESVWVSLFELWTPGLYHICPFIIFKRFQDLSNWLRIIARQPFKSWHSFPIRFNGKIEPKPQIPLIYSVN
jgi:hypothetical protein